MVWLRPELAFDIMNIRGSRFDLDLGIFLSIEWDVLFLLHFKDSGNGFFESPNTHPILVHLSPYHNYSASRFRIFYSHNQCPIGSVF